MSDILAYLLLSAKIIVMLFVQSKKEFGNNYKDDRKSFLSRAGKEILIKAIAQ